MTVRNDEQIRRYYSGQKERAGSNLSFRGGCLYSYGLPIVRKIAGGWITNSDGYRRSVTTSQHLNKTDRAGNGLVSFSALTMFARRHRAMTDEEVLLVDTGYIEGQRYTLLSQGDVWLLAGVDWLVELPRKAASDVEALEMLSPYGVVELPVGVKRQGEFYFEPTVDTDKSLKEYELYVANPRPVKDPNYFRGALPVYYTPIGHNVDLSTLHPAQRGITSNPHVATRAYMLPSSGKVLVKGTVRHPQHGMLRLGEVWHEVKWNNAAAMFSALGGGVD